jgi:hypothetical protein
VRLALGGIAEGKGVDDVEVVQRRRIPPVGLERLREELNGGARAMPLQLHLGQRGQDARRRLRALQRGLPGGGGLVPALLGGVNTAHHLERARVRGVQAGGLREIGQGGLGVARVAVKAAEVVARCGIFGVEPAALLESAGGGVHLAERVAGHAEVIVGLRIGDVPGAELDRLVEEILGPYRATALEFLHAGGELAVARASAAGDQGGERGHGEPSKWMGCVHQSVQHPSHGTAGSPVEQAPKREGCENGPGSGPGS